MKNAPVLVELTPDLAEFLVANCDSNLNLGLGLLQTLTSRDLQEKMVDNLEKFKQLKAAAQRAIKEHQG